MTKHPESRRPSPPPLDTLPTSARRFTPLVTVAAERTDSLDALNQFPPEVAPRRVAPESAKTIVRAAAELRASSPSSSAPIRRTIGPLIWLGVGLVASVTSVWIGVLYSRRADAPEVSQSPSPSPIASAEPIVPVAAVAVLPIAPVEPPVVPPPVVKRLEPSPPVERRQPRARDIARPQAPVLPKASPVAPTASRTAFLGTLAVDSEPAGARVFVNGQPVGSTPLVLSELRAGSRVVRVEAAGYAPWSSAIRVVANQQTRIAATLKR